MATVELKDFKYTVQTYGNKNANGNRAPVFKQEKDKTDVNIDEEDVNLVMKQYVVEANELPLNLITFCVDVQLSHPVHHCKFIMNIYQQIFVT